MRKRIRLDQNGITLIELLIAFVICAIIVGGIYRVFVAQTRAYTVQDQVVEVQQNIRTAMEILLRDIRMAGYDNDSLTSKINIANPILVDPVKGGQEFTVSYEYDDTHKYDVRYYLDNGNLRRELTISPDAGAPTQTTDTILENVEALSLEYGVDSNPPTGVKDGDWKKANEIVGLKVVAVRVVLTANPDQTNPDVKKLVSPRTLSSSVTLRNLCLR